MSSSSTPSTHPLPPASPSSVLTFASDDALVDALRKHLASHSDASISARGVFHVAVSGGSLPATLGRAMLQKGDDGKLTSRFDVSKWHWWFADERCVSLQDMKESNYAETNRHLFQYLDIPAGNMHAMDDSNLADTAATAASYERDLISAVGPTGALDLLLLGMGPDGHCCSLFPGHPLLHERQRLVAPITDSPKPPSCRITLTYTSVNNSRCSLFVIGGAGKADTMVDIIRQRASYANAVAKGDDVAARAVFDASLPSARVQSESVIYILDSGAAAKL